MTPAPEPSDRTGDSRDPSGASGETASTLRRLWVLVESIHAVVYFAPEKVAAYRRAGLRGGWMGYFASRAAALGPVDADLVAATFYNFHPEMVRRSIPDAWSFSSPQRVVEARYEAVEQALGRIIPPDHDDAVDVAWMLMSRLTRDLDMAGRPLAAAHASLPVPDVPRLHLWHACTVWREYRGDGHVAALLAHRVDPITAHLLVSGAGFSSEDALQPNRGWSEDEWADVRRQNVERGLLTQRGELTAEGHALRREVERMTDRLSPSVDALSEDELEQLFGALSTLVSILIAHGAFPFPNPMGLSEAEIAGALT